MVNADDFGMCNDENQATAEGLVAGIFTSSTILMTCERRDEALAWARAHPEADIGVHLTLNSEWPNYRWGPVLGARAVPSLVDENGLLWSSLAEIFMHVRLEEAEAELRAQIDLALQNGLDVTHLDCHMGPLHLSLPFHNLYVRLATDYQLPIRVAPRTMFKQMGMSEVLEKMDAAGILYPDNLVVNDSRTPATTAAYWTGMIRGLPRGISEFYCHPAYARAELRAIAKDAEQREADFRFFTSAYAHELIAREHVRLIGYRMLRDTMRGAKSPGAATLGTDAA
ncbi:MAG: polysaccharide deacetylase family protein [Candidatus Binataceae bacterium]